MSSFKNQFSRSISRDRIFQTCLRQYYFNYYGYRGGWEINAPQKVKQVEYNLFTNHGSEFNVSGAEIKNTKSYTTGSIADMQSLLVDVRENVPKAENAFLKVEYERVKADCNFKKVCG
jgi:hypothetical protein